RTVPDLRRLGWPGPGVELGELFVAGGQTATTGQPAGCGGDPVIPLILAAKAAVAVVLLASGGAKLADLTGFAGTIRLFTPARALPLTLAAAVAISATEV